MSALSDVASIALREDSLAGLLLDEPQLMGVESIEVGVNLPNGGAPLPGKQFRGRASAAGARGVGLAQRRYHRSRRSNGDVS